MRTYYSMAWKGSSWISDSTWLSRDHSCADYGRVMDNPFKCSYWTNQSNGGSIYCDKPAAVFYQTIRDYNLQTAYRIIGRCASHAADHPTAWPTRITREEILVQQIMESWLGCCWLVPEQMIWLVVCAIKYAEISFRVGAVHFSVEILDLMVHRNLNPDFQSVWNVIWHVKKLLLLE